MNLGDKVRLAREKAGLTQEELGTKLGKTQSYITHIENHRRTPDLDALKQISIITGVDLDFFVRDDVVVIPDESFSEEAKRKGVTKFVNYAVVVDKAISLDITPTELDRALDFIMDLKKKQGR